MKQFIVTIPKQEEAFFKKLMQSINFIDFSEEDTIYSIPDSHKTLVRERIEKYGSDRSNYLSRKELDEKIKFKQ
ncbi:MAG: hypothetical protein B6I19_01005 [Bacteroidetes bacterium 4572_114]|nr:MAG: hypothetical protein B6I19_01005 [Bacteroidetes bacterium 4572_114]